MADTATAAPEGRQDEGMPTAPLPAAAPTSGLTAPYPTLVSMNIIDLIMLDHNRLRAMYDAYWLPSMSLEQKQMLAWEIICELSVHAAKEEMVLYPAVRTALGDAVADRCLGDHQVVKGILARLDTMIVTDPSFDMLLGQAMTETMTHMAEEEGTFLPSFVTAVTPDSLLQLGIQFDAAKARAPTRPHPQFPNLPPMNEAANAAAATVDMAADQARLPSVTPILTDVRVGPSPTDAVAASPMQGAEGDTVSPASMPGVVAGRKQAAGHPYGMDDDDEASMGEEPRR